jgi:hypothetical protein
VPKNCHDWQLEFFHQSGYYKNPAETLSFFQKKSSPFEFDKISQNYFLSTMQKEKKKEKS